MSQPKTFLWQTGPGTHQAPTQMPSAAAETAALRRHGYRSQPFGIAPPSQRVSNLRRMKDSLADVLGPRGQGIVNAMQAGLRLLDSSDSARLLERAGHLISKFPAIEPIDKSALPDSYGGILIVPSDAFLAV